jgi:hypothetical protein
MVYTCKLLRLYPLISCCGQGLGTQHFSGWRYSAPAPLKVNNRPYLTRDVRYGLLLELYAVLLHTCFDGFSANGAWTDSRSMRAKRLEQSATFYHAIQCCTDRVGDQVNFALSHGFSAWSAAESRDQRSVSFRCWAWFLP